MFAPDTALPARHSFLGAVEPTSLAERRELIAHFNRLLSDGRNGAADASLTASLRHLQGLALRICLEFADTSADADADAATAHCRRWFEIVLMIDELAGQAKCLAPALLLLRFRVLDHRLHACLNSERFACAMSAETRSGERLGPGAVASLRS
jgi:hypothetical protein